MSRLSPCLIHRLLRWRFTESTPMKHLTALLALLPVLAHAGTVIPPNNVPEPETWALVALAGVIGAVVARNKRK